MRSSYFCHPLSPLTHALGVFRTFSLCVALLHVAELSHGAAENRHVNNCSVMYCHTQIDVHTITDTFMEVQGACQYSQDVLSGCLKKALGGPQFSQLGVMTGLLVWTVRFESNML